MRKNHEVNFEQTEFEIPARSLAESTQWAVRYLTKRLNFTVLLLI